MIGDFFILHKYSGGLKGGFFLRSELQVFFEKLEAQGLKPVAIRIDDRFQLEIFVEHKEIGGDENEL